MKHALPDDPAAIRHVREAVARLDMPSFTPLRQTLQDIRAGVEKRREELLLEAIALQEEGFAAAARIVLSAQGVQSLARPSYFEQFRKSAS